MLGCCVLILHFACQLNPLTTKAAKMWHIRCVHKSSWLGSRADSPFRLQALLPLAHEGNAPTCVVLQG